MAELVEDSRVDGDMRKMGMSSQVQDLRMDCCEKQQKKKCIRKRTVSCTVSQAINMGFERIKI